jgi:hypothetical protein
MIRSGPAEALGPSGKACPMAAMATVTAAADEQCMPLRNQRVAGARCVPASPRSPEHWNGEHRCAPYITGAGMALDLIAVRAALVSFVA